MERNSWLVALPNLALTATTTLMILILLVSLMSPMAMSGAAATDAADDATSSQEDSAPVVIFLLLPGITWSDLAAPPAASAWDWVWPRAVMGLMNSRSGSGFDPAAGYMTLGAGARALRLPAESGTVYQRDETLSGMGTVEWYRLWTGLSPGGAAVLFPGIEAVRNVHRSADHPVTPGTLGQWLRERGYTVAAFGNADLPEGSWRPVALAIMDEQGTVPRGRVDAELLTADPELPGGRGLDEERLGSLVEAELNAGTDLIAVEWSDLERIERGGGGGRMFAPGRQEHLRHQELARAGEWVRSWWERWQAAVRQPLVLVAVSPYPGKEATRRGELLTPIFVYQDRGCSGLLTSPTTRWRGIIANLDVAPSLVAIISGQELNGVTGRRWTVVTDPLLESDPGRALREITVLSARTTGVSYARPGVLRGYVLAQIITSLSLLALLLAAASGRLPAGRRLNALGDLLSLMVVTLVIVPAALLFATPLHSRGVGTTLAGALGGSLVAALLVLIVLCRPYRAVVWVAAVVTVGLTVDILTGAGFMRRSVLGYDPAVGARYYGIGNEYMGVLVGSATLVWTAALDWLTRPRFGPRPTSTPMLKPEHACRSRPEAQETEIQRARWVVFLPAVLGLITVLVIALPFWGANFGGALTAAAAGAVALLGAWEEAIMQSRSDRRSGQNDSTAPKGWSLSRRNWLWALLALMLVVAGLAVLDSLRPAPVRSHLGLLVGSIREEGVAALWQTIDRKLATNIKIMRYSIWTWGFAIGLVTLTLLFLRPTPGFRRLLADRPYLARGMMASAIASLVAFAANDSGVVAAATTLLFPASALLLLALEAVRATTAEPAAKAASGVTGGQPGWEAGQEK